MACGQGSCLLSSSRRARGLRRAAAAKILCWDRETLGLDPEICGQNGSPTSVVRCYTSESGLRTPRMLFTPEEGKNAILERLAIQ